MNRTLFLIPLLFLSINIAAQNNWENDKLDNRNGFKIFEFGQSIKDYENHLSNSGTNSPLDTYGKCAKTYRYLGNEPYELYDWEWKELDLKFCKGKLIEIYVVWDSNNDVYDDIVWKLTEVFGSPKTTQMTVTEIKSWHGKKVKMEITNGVMQFDPNAKSKTVTMTISNHSLANKLIYDFENEF